MRSIKFIRVASIKAVVVMIALLATALALLVLAAPARADTITVTNTADPGDGVCNSSCTLREAIAAARPRDTINFASSVTGTIRLSGSELVIDGYVIIEGPGADRLTVNGSLKSRVFHIRTKGGGSRNHVEINSLTIRGGDVRGESSSNGDGGGIYIDGSSVNLVNTTISGNNARSGGGITNDGGLVHLSKSTVSNNVSLAGGGIRTKGGRLDIWNSTVSGNDSGLHDNPGLGNGIYSGSSDKDDYGDVSVSNSTVSANGYSRPGSPSFGEGIYNRNGKFDLWQSTVKGNTGHNIVNSGELSLDRTIIADPLGVRNCVRGRDSIFDIDAVFHSNGDNLDSDGSCGLNRSTDINNMDPKLGALQNNGGPTRTHALLSGSPAIDKVRTSTYNCASSSRSSDQRGVIRPQDGDGSGTAECDIGSFEFERPLLPPTVDFCTLWDCVRPTITSLRPAAGSAIRDRTPTIRATVRDDRTNLAKRDIKLYVDGRRKTTFSYNRATDRLAYTSGKLAYGRHTVRILATDGRNETTRSWVFRVVR